MDKLSKGKEKRSKYNSDATDFMLEQTGEVPLST